MNRHALIPLAMLALLMATPAPAGPAQAFAVFRIVATTDTAIVDLSTDGWLTWSNALVGGSCVVERCEHTSSMIWQQAADFAVTDTLCRVHITSLSVAAALVLLPGGSFAMGNAGDPNEGWINELPAHSVTLSPFLMDNGEVSHALWREVHDWAVRAGYDFDFAGDGKQPDHPVHTVTWYDCVKWCNARSEKEGLTPVYATDADRTNVYRSGRAEIASDCVRWNATGYRLPTEAEWEFAARGGSAGHRFPWSDAETITHHRANYYSWGSDTYEYDATAAGTVGYHPAYEIGAEPFTSPIGRFAPNGFGLYDMAGNVWEWCWDFYGESWYQDPGATAADTPGPAAGAARVVRGGAWVGDAYSARCGYRADRAAETGANDVGFRCVRRP